MSFPSTVSMSNNHHQISALDFPEAARRYRRFSNVSDAVSRKLSTTLGWRTVSVQEVVTQAKSLCGQHIRAWLKRRGLFTRKLGLQRLRSVASLPGGLAVVDVFVQLEGELQQETDISDDCAVKEGLNATLIFDPKMFQELLDVGFCYFYFCYFEI